NALREQGQLDEAIDAFTRAAELRPSCGPFLSNRLYALHYRSDCDAQALYHEHRKWNAQYADPLKSLIRPHDNDRDPDRRLRIGYLSPDFGQHPVGRFLLPLVQKHDRSQVEVFCFSQVTSVDPTTAQFRATTDVWRNIVPLTDEHTADLIRKD